jgi:hypothetical protein
MPWKNFVLSIPYQVLHKNSEKIFLFVILSEGEYASRSEESRKI